MNQDDYDRLIAGLYTSVAEGNDWADVLADICGLFGAKGALIGIQHHNTGGSLVRFHGLDPRLMTLFLGEYTNPHTNPAVRAMSRYPLGTFIRFPDMVGGSAHFRKTDFYEDIWRPQSIDGGVVSVLSASPEGVATISLLGGQLERAIDPDTMQSLQRLVPHLRTANEIYMRTMSLQGEADELRSVADRVTCGLLTVDEHSTILRLNRAAEEILAAGDGLSIRRGCLIAETIQNSRTLAEHISSAAAAAKGGLGAGGAVSIQRRSGRRPLAVQILPLRSHVPGFDGANHPRVLVSIVDPERPITLLGRRLTELFGLSPTESQLAIQLAQGKRLDMIAAERDVGMPTVRTQLRAVLRKTGSDRQSDLVALLTRLAINEGTYQDRSAAGPLR